MQSIYYVVYIVRMYVDFNTVYGSKSVFLSDWTTQWVEGHFYLLEADGDLGETPTKHPDPLIISEFAVNVNT